MRVRGDEEAQRRPTARRVTAFVDGVHLTFHDVRVWISLSEGLVHLLEPELGQPLVSVPLRAVEIDWGAGAAVGPGRRARGAVAGCTAAGMGAFDSSPTSVGLPAS